MPHASGHFLLTALVVFIFEPKPSSAYTKLKAHFSLVEAKSGEGEKRGKASNSSMNGNSVKLKHLKLDYVTLTMTFYH